MSFLKIEYCKRSTKLFKKKSTDFSKKGQLRIQSCYSKSFNLAIFYLKKLRFLYTVIATKCAVIPKFSINYLKIGDVAVVYKTAEGLVVIFIIMNI